MFINRKFQALIFTTLLISTQSVVAKTTDMERVNTIAQSLIGTFSGAPNQAQFIIKMTAAMEDVSESEIQKRFNESDSKPQSMSESTLEILKQQYNAQDLKIMVPAFQKQIAAQGSVYNSCKIDGNPKENTESFEVPLTCNVPEINFEKIQVAKKSTKDSDAQYVAKYINILVDQISKAPRALFKTNILIHKQDNQLIPEMDDPNYFPNTVSNKMTGTTEKELMQENQKSK